MRLILIVCFLTLFSCAKKFDKKVWNSDFIDDKITYENRNEILDDLLDNYQLKGKTVSGAEQIMGKFEKEDFVPNKNQIKIPVLVEWQGIDPSSYKYLILHYNQNRVIDSVYIVKEKF